MSRTRRIVERIGPWECCHFLTGATIACAVAYAEASLGGTTGAAWGLIASCASGAANELGGGVTNWHYMLAMAMGGLIPFVVDISCAMLFVAENTL